MYLKKILKFTSALLLMLSFAGCGSEGNSNTNGDMLLTTVAPVSAGVVNLMATATVTSSRSSDLAGIPVTFSAKQYGVDTTGTLITEVSVQPKEQTTNASGVAIWFANFPQRSYATTLEVTASTGGITKVSQVPIAAATVTAVP